ncbi:MAG: short-chain dehydrogenase, partial [Deltaproteobacteria bacterium]
DVLPPDLFEKLKPEYVAPMVLYLASDRCEETGMIFNAGMGHFSRVAMIQGAGVVVGEGESIPTPEELQKTWEHIDSLEGAKEYYNATVALTPMLEAVSGGAEGAQEGGEGLTVRGVFERLPEMFQSDKAAGVDVVFQFKIEGPGGGGWHVVVKDGKCEVKEGEHGSPTTTILMNEEDFLALMGGQLNAMAAYTSGKLKIEGDLMKSQLVEKLFKLGVS